MRMINIDDVVNIWRMAAEARGINAMVILHTGLALAL
jgi:hypothetical protein